MMACIIALLAVFLAISVAANGGITYGLIEATQRLNTNPKSHVLTDNKGNAVSTAEAQKADVLRMDMTDRELKDLDVR